MPGLARMPDAGGEGQTGKLFAMWADAASSGDLLSLHVLLDAAGNSGAATDGDGIPQQRWPISASGC